MPDIPPLVASIRSAIPLDEIVGETVYLERSEHHLRGRCNMHPDPRGELYLGSASTFYHCFGCGRHGDVIAWVMDLRGVEEQEAIDLLLMRMTRSIDRATEPFFTTKGTGKGTGLGLAMASSFVQQSRERLEIDSTLGKGTTIRMLFPSASEDQPEDFGTTRLPVSAHTDNVPSSAHILIVEDSTEVLALAREILEDVGYRVSTAETGEAALELFEAMPPGTLDLLLIDLITPGGTNGIVLAGEIARRAPNLPVLITSGYNEELVADGPMRAGLDVLSKPYRQSDLLDRVRQALNRGSGSAGE